MLFSCGKSPSSRPERKTAENSRPLAECTVISCSASWPGRASWSPASRLACDRNAASTCCWCVPTGEHVSRADSPAGVVAVLELLGEERGGVHQLVQVLEAVLAVALGGVVGLERAALEDLLDDLRQAQRLGRCLRERIDHRDELRDGRAAAPADQRPRAPPCIRLRRNAAATRFLQLLDAARADAARREVHHAREGGVVVGVRGQAQVGERVLHLLALEEAQARRTPCRRCPARNSECSRMRDWALERYSSAMSESAMPSRCSCFTSSTTNCASSRVVGGGVDAQLLALALVGPQVLAEARLVLRDHRVGRVEDVALRAVVLLELHHVRDREVLHELVHVADFGAAEAVYRVVGDDAVGDEVVGGDHVDVEDPWRRRGTRLTVRPRPASPCRRSSPSRAGPTGAVTKEATCRGGWP